MDFRSRPGSAFLDDRGRAFLERPHAIAKCSGGSARLSPFEPFVKVHPKNRSYRGRLSRRGFRRFSCVGRSPVAIGSGVRESLRFRVTAFRMARSLWDMQGSPPLTLSPESRVSFMVASCIGNGSEVKNRPVSARTVPR